MSFAESTVTWAMNEIKWHNER